MLKPRPEGGEGVGYADIWGRPVLMEEVNEESSRRGTQVKN